MNFQNLNFDYVEQSRSYPEIHSPAQSLSSQSDATLRDINADPNADVDNASCRPASLSLPPTVILRAPTPTSPSTSTTDFYGPDRLFRPPTIASPNRNGRPRRITHPQFRGPGSPRNAMDRRRTDWEGHINASMLTGFRDKLVTDAGRVTPGVDDTPCIRYALEALTRDWDSDSLWSRNRGGDVENAGGLISFPSHVLEHDHHLFERDGTPEDSRSGRGPPIQRPQIPPSLAQSQHDRIRDPLRPVPVFEQGDLGLQENRHVPSPWLPRVQTKAVQPYQWRSADDAVMGGEIAGGDTGEYPPLNFRPFLLRPVSFLIFMFLCALMIAALMLSALYSHAHDGLLAYGGLIYGGQYFVFRILPQMLAALIFVYAQCIVMAMFRILPFLRLASDSPKDREGALFQDLYPKSFLLPQLIGDWKIWSFILTAWLGNFTLPLQSCLFTVTLVQEKWKWATVQGVAWTLVALYVALFAAVIVAFSFWTRSPKTGLLWDPRSIADIAMIVSETNVAADYHGTELAGSRDRLRFALRRRRHDKLGYWTWKDGQPGVWYTLGNPMDDINLLPFHDNPEDQDEATATKRYGSLGGYDDRDAETMGHSAHVRYRYLPWCLRNNQILYFIVTAFVLLFALLVVSFLPSTRIAAGFRPWLSAGPVRGAFSAADFLYSFLPSLLGLILYLLFQALELSVRILQPWAALSCPRGARAEGSILADYAACVPLQSVVHAARNGHWRLAFLSLMSALFLLLPVLGGGLFMALTRADGEVRMYPNIPSYAIIVSLLVLYLISLISLLPRRGDFRLPHSVTCLAEVISFLANADLLGDPAFKGCRSLTEMRARVTGASRSGGGAARAPDTRWAFGVDDTGASLAGPTLGVRRMLRFTEKRRVRKSQIHRL
ncbi:hypothetical protein VTK73DRAFT_5356 [Phialemonium thermophilum]|uniref:Phosphoribosylaminoimidazole-succinocarboxamide synthase n=1 Tax=Phialemonium thermophilum TaxID=223376 RepID=A0ABR3Y8C0_9PEZI